MVLLTSWIPYGATTRARFVYGGRICHTQCNTVVICGAPYRIGIITSTTTTTVFVMPYYYSCWISLPIRVVNKAVHILYVRSVLTCLLSSGLTTWGRSFSAVTTRSCLLSIAWRVRAKSKIGERYAWLHESPNLSIPPGFEPAPRLILILVCGINVYRCVHTVCSRVHVWLRAKYIYKKTATTISIYLCRRGDYPQIGKSAVQWACRRVVFAHASKLID